MINFSILSSDSDVIGPGGLFDFNATLPLVMVQFIGLIFILNILLYEPLLQTIQERKDYILKNLSEASELLIEADMLVANSEEKLIIARQKAEKAIANSQQIHKNEFENQLNISQQAIDELLNAIIYNLFVKERYTRRNHNLAQFSTKLALKYENDLLY